MALTPGDIFKTSTGDVWFVDTVSASGAYCIHLSAHPTPITTRKKVTKIVNRHYRNAVFSLDSLVDLVDRSRLDTVQLRRRITMARREASVAEPGTETTEAKAPAASKERVVQRYIRTEKVPAKEMRGQAKETLDALNKATGPVTAKEVADACVYAGSRQDKERVAGFYLSQFKKDGLVTVAPAEQA